MSSGSDTLRPLIDEISEPSTPSTIVLKYLEDHLLNSSITKTLNRKELKYVSRGILEALKVLHENRYVHTGKRFNPPHSEVLPDLMLQTSNPTMCL